SASRGNSARSAATKSAPQEPARPQSEQSDAAPANAAEAGTDPGGKTAHASGRFDEKGRGTRRYARNWRDRRDTEFEPQDARAQEGAMFEPRDRWSYPEFGPRDRRGRAAYAEFESR